MSSSSNTIKEEDPTPTLPTLPTLPPIGSSEVGRPPGPTTNLQEAEDRIALAMTLRYLTLFEPGAIGRFVNLDDHIRARRMADSILITIISHLDETRYLTVDSHRDIDKIRADLLQQRTDLELRLGQKSGR